MPPGVSFPSPLSTRSTKRPSFHGRDPIGQLHVHLGPNAGRVTAGGDRAGGVDDASHPVVGGDELDDLLRQHERQPIEGHREHGDRVDLRHVRSDVSPERHRGAGVGGNELVDRDAETPLPAPLVLVVHDVAVDLAVAVVDVEISMRTVERGPVGVPPDVAAINRAVDGRRAALVALAHGVEVGRPARPEAFGLARRERGQGHGRDAPHAELAADLPPEPAVEARRRRMQRADHESLLVHPFDGTVEQPGCDPPSPLVGAHRDRRHCAHRDGPTAEELTPRHDLGRADELRAAPRGEEVLHALGLPPRLLSLGRARERLAAEREDGVGLFVPRRVDLDVHGADAKRTGVRSAGLRDAADRFLRAARQGWAELHTGERDHGQHDP